MAEVKQVRTNTDNEVVVDRAKDFWGQYSKPIIVGGAILLLVVGGWFGYKNFIQEPKEQKAAEAIFKAEEYYRQDSLKLALSGDGQYAGFEKIIGQYGGTKAGNMAKFYAGSIYLQQGNFTKAISNLEDFDTDALQIKARAYKLLADAYADAGKNNDAFEHYKKAATTFEDVFSKFKPPESIPITFGTISLFINTEFLSMPSTRPLQIAQFSLK